MPITRVVHGLRKNNDDPRDTCINVWHFWHPFALNVLLAQKIGFAVSAFYSAFNQYHSVSLKRTNGQTLTVSALNPGLAGPDDDIVAPAVFAFEDSLTSGTAPSGDPLPNEVSICLSFSSDLTNVPESAEGGTMRPASRRRGRLYLGPLQASVLDADPVTFEPRLDVNIKNALVNHYGALISALQNTTTPTDVPQRVSHVIYSPTTGIEWPVSNMWIDLEFDTVRSRGIKGFGKIDVPIVQSQALV